MQTLIARYQFAQRFLHQGYLCVAPYHPIIQDQFLNLISAAELNPA